MKNIINKFKKILTSEEAVEFAQEVKETAENLKNEASDLVKEGAEKTKEAASAVKQRTDAVVKAAKEPTKKDGMITYDQFQNVEVRVGTILSAEKIEKSDKLLLLKVDVGESESRQIVSGIATYFDDVQSLVDRQAMFVTNLEPRTIFGHESNGMIFAVNDDDNFSILEPDMAIVPGTKAS